MSYNINKFSITEYNREKVKEQKQKIVKYVSNKSIQYWKDYNIVSHTFKNPLTYDKIVELFPGAIGTNIVGLEDELIYEITLCYSSYEAYIGIRIEPWITFESFLEPPTDIDPELDTSGFNDDVLNFWEELIKL